MSVKQWASDQIRARPRATEALRSLLTSWSVHKAGPLPDIAIVSSRRSGSTWLMEMIGSLPRIRFVNEPFLHSLVARRRLPTGLSPTIPSHYWKVLEVPADEEERFRRHILDPGETRIRGPYDPFSPTFHMVTDRRVLKVVHGTALADWLEGLGIRCVFLFRHPIATAESMVRSGVTTRVESNLTHRGFVESYLDDDLISFANEVLTTGSSLEKAALEWCLDNLGPLRASRERPAAWTRVSYEELVLNPVDVLEFLEQELQLPSTEPLLRNINRPSASTLKMQREGVLAHDEKLVSSWRERIPKTEGESAMRIVDRFGIELYRYSENLPQKAYRLRRRGP